jgi:hypothetical protein
MASHANDQILQYMIDSEDRITYVSDTWWLFAEENGADAHLYPPRLLGRLLWSYIAGEETRQLYRILLDRVRRQKQTVQVPIRCDSPELRRELSLRLKAVGSGHVEFICRTTRVETREPVELLRRHPERAERTLDICSFCKKIMAAPDEWVATDRAIERLALFDAAALPRLSHGVCPACYSAAIDGP